MRCDDAQPLLSAAFDEPLGADEATALAAHLTACEQCEAFQAHLDQLRRELRYEAVEDVPDVAPAVLATVRTRRPRPRWAPLAAAFAASVVAGAAFVGFGFRQPTHIAVADLPQRVLAAQSAVDTLAADVQVVERGWHDDIGTRTYSGTLAYRSPESVALHLQDETAYPSASWIPNDVTVVVDEDRSWSRGPAACPRELLPDCAGEPRTRAVVGREPFDPSMPAPLDLVVPARSFMLAQQPTILGTTRLDGRPAVGMAVTAAQLGPLLDGVRAAGHWREVHPADQAELWLDAHALVPLAVRVLPGEGTDRELWAARRGYRDPAGVPVLELRLTDVTVNEPVPRSAFPTVPDDALVRDAGFQPAETGIDPEWLPEGMRLHRAGAVTGDGPEVEVAAWTDGRAWVTIRRTGQWPGGRLFGDLGEHARPVRLRDGVAYVGAGKVGLHAAEEDLVVAGSVRVEALQRVAGSLGARGRQVPGAWTEASAGPVDGLLLPVDLGGFSSPAVRSGPAGTTAVFHGPGDRAFTLTHTPGDSLAPPFEGDVRGVQVRGVAGRYTPSLGELEWIEDGEVLSLRSDTLSLAELVAIAETLERR